MVVLNDLKVNEYFEYEGKIFKLLKKEGIEFYCWNEDNFKSEYIPKYAKITLVKNKNNF